MPIIKIIAFVLTYSIINNSVAAGFDCSAAATNVEKIICGSEILNKLDEQNTELFNNAKNDLPDSSLLVNDQRNWLKATRNVCIDEKCLIETYKSRNYVLENMQSVNSVDTQSEAKPVLSPQEILQKLSEKLQTKSDLGKEEANAEIKNAEPIVSSSDDSPPVLENNTELGETTEFNTPHPEIEPESVVPEPAPISNATAEEQSQEQQSSSYISNFGYPIGNIFTIALILIPIILFVYQDSKYKLSEGCEKVRPIPTIPMILLGIVIYMASTAVSENVFLLALILYVPLTRYFVIEAVGYVLDPNGGVIHLPGSTRDADSFLSYLNPMFLLSPFFKDQIEINSLRGMSQREEIRLMNGRREIKHILNISTREGNRIMKFSSAAKCDRLNDLFANAMKITRINVVEK